jgi:hypothetical protein
MRLKRKDKLHLAKRERDKIWNFKEKKLKIVKIKAKNLSQMNKKKIVLINN